MLLISKTNAATSEIVNIVTLILLECLNESWNLELRILSFSNTCITALQILDVEAVILIVAKHPFHEYNASYSPSVGLFYIYYKKLSHQNTVKIKLHFQTNKRLFSPLQII
jgi:hypothetical protein